MIGKLVEGSIPSSRSPDGASNSSIAFARVNSSGASDSGIFASLRSSPSMFCCKYAPKRPTRISISGDKFIVLVARASMTPRSAESSLSPGWPSTP